MRAQRTFREAHLDFVSVTNLRSPASWLQLPVVTRRASRAECGSTLSAPPCQHKATLAQPEVFARFEVELVIGTDLAASKASSISLCVHA